MTKKLFNFLKISRLRNNKGFTLLEILVYLAILSLVLLLIISFIFWINSFNAKTKAKREGLENARRALEIMTYEIKGAKSVYTPTTALNQLSLETSRYLPNGETYTFIDFFLCGSRICLKKESQDPIFLTSDAVETTQLEFTQVSINGSPSIKINLTINYENPIILTSTVSLRNY